MKTTLTAYCSDCGEQLIIKNQGVSYDNETGEPKHWYNWKCPNSRWFSMHDTGFTVAGSDKIIIHNPYDIY